MTVRPTVRPHYRETNVYSHTLQLIAHQFCDQLTAIDIKTGYLLTSITWPYHGLTCWPIEVEYFLKLSTDILSVSNDRRLKFIFSMIRMKYVVFMSLWPHTIRILISNWPRTQKFSQFFLKIRAGKTFSYHGHALVTLYVQFLCSDWSILTGEFMRKIYSASWKLFTLAAEADRVLCQLQWCFNCLFSLDVQNEIQLLSRAFCYSWLVC